MSREIKFRGRTPESDWVYGCFVKDQDGTCSIVNNYGGSYTWDTVEPESVGQYTGLKDRNEVEVYEGDFVKCLGAPSGSSKQAYQMLGRIDQDFFGWPVTVWHKGEWWAYGKMSYNSLEVVGNVYQHPELIGKEVAV